MKLFPLRRESVCAGKRRGRAASAWSGGAWIGIVLGLMVLCSCRGGPTAGSASSCPPPSPTLPPEAFGQPTAWQTGAAMPWGVVQDPESGQWVPAPAPLVAYGPWTPPGFAQPWPDDEYLRDGGDAGLPSVAAPDGEVRGLEIEDTIALYDAADGRKQVEPSNRVHLYSPRFGAVRQVSNLLANEGRDGWANVYQPTKLIQQEIRTGAYSHKQHLATGRYVSQDMAGQYLSRLTRDVVSSALGPQSFQDRFLPYEDFQIIRLGRMDQAERPKLHYQKEAAVAWSKDETLTVILDEQRAAAAVHDDALVELYVVHEPPANPKLRLVKVASTAYAEPGDVVDFTLRFDNVGNQPIRNVTLLDNLSGRLEYVADSAQCSLKAQFTAQPNEAGSQLLRWELAQPLKPGEGGVIRFRCRVR